MTDFNPIVELLKAGKIIGLNPREMLKELVRGAVSPALDQPEHVPIGPERDVP